VLLWKDAVGIYLVPASFVSADVHVLRLGVPVVLQIPRHVDQRDGANLGVPQLGERGDGGKRPPGDYLWLLL
jgi:hypothetical protein